MAGLIKKEDIEKVRGSADLYDVVSQTVSLKTSGAGTYVGLCPFHEEKTPSFTVRPSLGMWHCFGCGLGGDVFSFVERRDGVEFGEAVETLADMFHIQLHRDTHAFAPTTQGSKRSRLLEANEAAQKYFVEQMESTEAQEARKLLEERHFSPEQWAYFGCGYSSRGWDGLTRHLFSLGFSQKEILDAGLARANNQGGIYDYFRGRLMWPIRDAAGRTLGFGARRLYDDDKLPAKYINTPDTMLYKKAEVLYGLDLARDSIVKKRQMIIVEGYTDVMACHLAGVDIAVATCGTAFGAQHARIARRLIADQEIDGIQLVGPRADQTSRVIFTFDGDSAGQKAAHHALRYDSTFLAQNYVSVVPDELDPCDLRIQRGDQAVRDLVTNAIPFYEFLVDSVIKKMDLRYISGRVGALKAISGVLANIRDKSLLDAYERDITRRIGLDLEEVRQSVNEEKRRNNIKSDDAYAPKTSSYVQASYGSTYYPAAGSNTGFNSYETSKGRGMGDENQVSGSRLAIINQAALDQRAHYPCQDDTVFKTEQQIIAAAIQLPLAIDRKLFEQLTPESFLTPVYRTLFCAITVAGGIPNEKSTMEIIEDGDSEHPRHLPITQGLWVHNLMKAAGPALDSTITELAVMNLPVMNGSPNDPTNQRKMTQLEKFEKSNSSFVSNRQLAFQQQESLGKRSKANRASTSESVNRASYDNAPSTSSLRAVTVEAQRGSVLAPPTEEAKNYTSELLWRLLDLRAVRELAYLKVEMDSTQDENIKLGILGRTSELKKKREEYKKHLKNTYLLEGL